MNPAGGGGGGGGGLPCKKDVSSSCLVLEASRWKFWYQDPVMYTWLDIFSPLRSTSSRTTN